MLLMIVFAVKAALFPVQFWLPGTYANAPAPVAALFAIMTKVGAYAIIRIHTIAFGPGVDATSDMASTWLFPAAIVTVAVGAFGVLGARRLLPLIAFSAVGSMGTLLLAVAAFSPQALTAALYYVVHSTFAAAALFLVADLVVTRRQSDTLTALPATVQNGLFASLFFAGAIAMAGMPPLSGFLGKLLVLDALRAPGVIGWAWGAILIGSLLTIVGFARAGSIVFWKSTAILPEPVAGEDETAVLRAPPIGAARPTEVAPAMMLIGLLAMLAVFAGPVADYLEATAAQIFDRAGYVAAVLPPDGEV
jgi:multicomponent K+:H+ antiporter subunit D